MHTFDIKTNNTGDRLNDKKQTYKKHFFHKLKLTDVLIYIRSIGL